MTILDPKNRATRDHRSSLQAAPVNDAAVTARSVDGELVIAKPDIILFLRF